MQVFIGGMVIRNKQLIFQIWGGILGAWRGRVWGLPTTVLVGGRLSSNISSLFVIFACVECYLYWLLIEFRGRNSLFVGVNVTPGISVDCGISWDMIYPGVMMVWCGLELHSCDSFWFLAVSSFYGKSGRVRRLASFLRLALDIDMKVIDITLESYFSDLY